ncbi:MAG: ribonuclease P protein component [Bryobacteraceae bacterium]
MIRNRIRRRVREAFRVRMPDLGPNWWIVINPRRKALDAPFEELKREVEKVVQRCAKS